MKLIRRLFCRLEASRLMRGVPPLAVCLSLIASNSYAETGSSLWLKWRSFDDQALCVSPSNYLVSSVLADSNYLIRGEPVFHRPLEDLLAQKAALVPSVSVKASDNLELGWNTALPLQFVSVTRQEVRHTVLTQNLRFNYCIPLNQNSALLTSGVLAFSTDENFGLRGDFGLTYLKRIRRMTLELGLVQHQAIYGESRRDWSFLNIFAEAYQSYKLGNSRLLPYVRLSAERRVFRPDTLSALAFQTGVRGSYILIKQAELSLLWTIDLLYRRDLSEYTGNAGIGLSWLTLFSPD